MKASVFLIVYSAQKGKKKENHSFDLSKRGKWKFFCSSCIAFCAPSLVGLTKIVCIPILFAGFKFAPISENIIKHLCCFLFTSPCRYHPSKHNVQAPPPVYCILMCIFLDLASSVFPPLILPRREINLTLYKPRFLFLHLHIVAIMFRGWHR